VWILEGEGYVSDFQARRARRAAFHFPGNGIKIACLVNHGLEDRTSIKSQDFLKLKKKYIYKKWSYISLGNIIIKNF